MNGAKYWIWLQSALGAGRRTDEIVAFYSDAEEIYKSSPFELRMSGCFSEAAIKSLAKTDLSAADGVIDICRKNGWKIITYADDAFPQRLRTIPSPPLVLYVSGDENALSEEFSIAMVGARKATEYGARAADELSYRLSKSGAVIVSGGAVGIDSFSHLGALRAGGRTVGVLGCGLGAGYLMQNEPLRRRISQSGALVTEFQPNTMPSRRSFPIRNRIISGLSYGVVVIEAGLRSGSLITASCALEQGREVFAVPGRITEVEFAGANTLIRDGARPVFSVRDVLDPYAAHSGAGIVDFDPPYDNPQEMDFQSPEPVKTKAKEKNAKEKEERKPLKAIDDSVSADARRVYDAIKSGAGSADVILEITGLSMGKLLAAATELEMNGFISVSGDGYEINA